MALPQLHTMDEVAQALHISRRKLQDVIKERPFYRQIGRQKVFTEADIKALVESLSCPSSSPNATAEKTGTSVAPSEASLWTKLQALTTAKEPKKSASAGKRKSSTVVSMAFEKQQRSLKPV